MKRGLLLGALALGCSSSGGGGNGGSCEETVIDGVYLATYTLVSGDCPALDSHLVREDGSDEPNPDCVETYERNGCRVEFENMCVDDMNRNVDWVGYVDVRADGSTMVGSMTIHANDNAGFSCTGTYRVSWVRQ
jgi:hypothetical protein